MVGNIDREGVKLPVIGSHPSKPATDIRIVARMRYRDDITRVMQPYADRFANSTHSACHQGQLFCHESISCSGILHNDAEKRFPRQLKAPTQGKRAILSAPPRPDDGRLSA
jgi:hypothetical protein